MAERRKRARFWINQVVVVHKPHPCDKQYAGRIGKVTDTCNYGCLLVDVDGLINSFHWSRLRPLNAHEIGPRRKGK